MALTFSAGVIVPAYAHTHTSTRILQCGYQWHIKLCMIGAEKEEEELRYPRFTLRGETVGITAELGRFYIGVARGKLGIGSLED